MPRGKEPRTLAFRLRWVLQGVAQGTIRRGIDFRYRRNDGSGYVCDTLIYSLEERGYVTLRRDGTVALTEKGDTEVRKETVSC